MSWSVNFQGKPQDIVDQLNTESANLSDQSKAEFDAALPHLIGIVEQNWNMAAIPNLTLSAHGHGYSDDSERHCSVTLSS